MRLVLSPYEIDCASPAAAAAMLLGEEEGGILTIQPTPFVGADAESAREAAARAPSYSRLLEKWRWTGPLWKSGALRAAGSGQGLAAMLGQSAAAMAADRSLVAARGFLHLGANDDESVFLESLSRDLIRGGSDPAISLPLVAVTEQLAMEAEAALVCGESGGMIWKPRPGTPTGFTFSIPLVLGASGSEILALRAALREPLEAFRTALGAAVTSARAGQLNGHAGAVRVAADHLSQKFREVHGDSTGGRQRESFGRPVEATFSVSVVPSGRAVREAVGRLSRIVPASAPSGGTGAPAAALDRPIRSLALIRVRLAAWDFGQTTGR